MRNLIYIIFLILSFNGLAQKTYTHIALINATAHIGNGKLIENSLVVINKDKIETVSETKGLRLDYRSFDTVIDLAGKQIYPGLINTNNLGPTR